MLKLTPWFSGDVKPVHVGVYQRLQNGQNLYWRWNGARWDMGGYRHARDVPECSVASISQNYSWRGLAAPAE